jgi:hypothetical protein
MAKDSLGLNYILDIPSFVLAEEYGRWNKGTYEH